MSIVKKSFGKLPDGREADLYILTNKSGASVEITNYGGIIRAINVPDRAGKLGNVVLGYNDVAGYVPTCGYLGALIGRVGNRIAKGECELNGQKLTLAKNERGVTHLHGGNVGFNEKLWDVTPVEGICEDDLILKYTSPDGEEGYPGTLKVKVTYTFDDENALTIRYEADTDQDTPVNLTNHAYFNLNCGGKITNHTLTLDCSRLTVVDDECIPTGELRDVTGTVFDFRGGRLIGQDIDADDEQIKNGKGYDHNFVIDGTGFRRCARLEGQGRSLTVYTDLPGVQFYAGNMLESDHPGKQGEKYYAREGMCLETQFHPDSVNQPSFPDSVLKAGAHYDHSTKFVFGV